MVAKMLMLIYLIIIQVVLFFIIVIVCSHWSLCYYCIKPLIDATDICLFYFQITNEAKKLFVCLISDFCIIAPSSGKNLIFIHFAPRVEGAILRNSKI